METDTEKKKKNNHYYHQSGANKRNRSKTEDSQKPRQCGIDSDCKKPFTLDART